jgi:hypothetical protein
MRIKKSKNILPLFAFLFVVTSFLQSGFFVSTASAALVTDDAQIKNNGITACGKAYLKNTPDDKPENYKKAYDGGLTKVCVETYIAVYSGNGTQADYDNACKQYDNNPGNQVGITQCDNGRNAAKADRANDTKGTASDSSTLSDDKVKAIGKADPACAASATQDACVAGFTQGYKDGSTGSDSKKNTFCDHKYPNKGSRDHQACGAGYDAGQDSRTNNITAAAPVGDDANATDSQPNCQNTGNSLSFFVCPFIEGVAGASDWIFDTFIEGLLSNIPISTDPSDPSFKSWQGFRLLGNIVLVGALLIMALAQGFGERFVDAYTIRKMAPRLLVGAIAVNLSIYLGVAVADVAKVVGNGVGGLLTQPFIGAGNFNYRLGDSGVVANALGVAFGGISVAAVAGTGFLSVIVFRAFRAEGNGALTAAAINGLMWVFLFVLLPILLISLAVLVTLVIRQGLLVFLVIIAPVAFALYVLPGTERYFKTWWSLFSKTLMVYPIISVIFALSDILSTIMFRTNQSVIGVIAGMIVMFLPLVLVPFSFRFAGSAVGGIWNFAQGGLAKANMPGRAKAAYGKAKQDPNNYIGKNANKVKGVRDHHGLYAGAQLGMLAEGRRARQSGRSFSEGYQGERARFAGDAAIREANDLAEHSNVVKALDDDTAKGVIRKSHGGTQEEVADEMKLAAPSRFMDEALVAGHSPLHDAIIAKLTKAAADKGETFNLAAYNAQNSSPNQLAERRQALNGSMALVNQVSASADRQVAEIVALNAIASTTTGEGETAKLSRRVAEASHGDANLMAKILQGTKQRQMQAGMVGHGGSSFPTHYDVVRDMMSDMANGVAVDDAVDGEYSKRLYRSVREKQPPHVLANMDNRALIPMLESGVFEEPVIEAFNARDGVERVALQTDQHIEAHHMNVQHDQSRVEALSNQLKAAMAAGNKPAADTLQLQVTAAQSDLKKSSQAYDVALQSFSYTGPTGVNVSYADADREYQAVMAKTAAIHDLMGNSARNNQTKFYERLTSVHLGSPAGPSVAKEFTRMRSDPHEETFHELRREWVQAAEQEHAAAMAAAGAAGAGGGPGAAGGGGGGGGGGGPSDIRFKTNISHIATTSTHIKLYKFRYAWEKTYRVGVMAQEILQSNPGAVVHDKFGYLYVRYDQLGLRMITWEEWLAGESVIQDPTMQITYTKRRGNLHRNPRH